MPAQEGIAGFLNAIPSAATSPLAFLAYIAALIAWVVIGLNTNRLRVIMPHISSLPKKDQIAAIHAAIGYVAIPTGLTGEEYLRRRIHTFVFSAFMALIAVIAFIIGLTFYKYYERRMVADNMINNILTAPSSDFMHAVNDINAGLTMVTNAAKEIGPEISPQDLVALVESLQRQHLNGEQINKRLAEAAGTDALRAVNQKLIKASEFLENTFTSLAICFRELACAAGNQFPLLCQYVTVINKNIHDANKAGRGIHGVSYNASKSGDMLGGGSMDVYFKEFSSKSVSYLASQCPS